MGWEEGEAEVKQRTECKGERKAEPKRGREEQGQEVTKDRLLKC